MRDNMTIATHVIKIRGIFDENIWKEDELKNYVASKIKKEIYHTFHADLELFQVDGDKIEIWIYISAYPSEVTNNIIGKWIVDHIKEEGITANDFEFEMIVDITKKDENKFFVLIPRN